MRSLLLAVYIAWTSSALANPTVAEAPTPAVSSSGSLVEDVGIETLGGTFTAIIKHGCQVPCSSTQVFSTADDNQSEIKLTLVRGITKLAKDGHILGKFSVVGIPPERRGIPSVAITFFVSRDEITLEAFDNHAKRPLAVQRREF